MCGSASERTRAISWGEMVIEEFPAPAVAPRAATSPRLLAGRRPGRKRVAPLTPVARVFLLVMPGLDPGIHRKSISSARMDCRVISASTRVFRHATPGNDGGVSVPHPPESERARLSRAALLDEPCDGGAQLGY